MSVNGSINKRLDTSLGLLATGPATLGRRLKEAGQTARASVDIGFSRQLSQAQFQAERDAKQEERAVRRAKELQAQKIEAEENKQRIAMQMKLVEDGISAIKEFGNSGPLIRIMQSPGLTDVAREWATRSVNAHLPQGMDGLKKEAELKAIKNRMKNDDKRILMERERIDNQAEQALQDDIREDGKIAYDRSIDMINAEQSVINRNSYLNHILQNSWMFTEEELQAARDTMQFGDEATIKEYWKNAWNVANARLLSKRKDDRNAAQIEGRVPSAVTGNELREVEYLMRSSIDQAIQGNETVEEALDTEFFNWLWLRDRKAAKQNRNSIVFATTRIAKTLGRTGSPSAADPFMQDALKLSLMVDIEETDDGVRVDTANSLRFAEEIKRLQQINPAITLAGFVKSMENNPDTDPEEILNQIKRKAGIQ